MAMNLQIENILIQVRSRLQDAGVKLWNPPYYVDGIGPVDSELETLARNMCEILNIPFDYCLAAINELQTNAIDKLRARDDFAKTGIATLKVRVPNQVGGTRLLTIQVDLRQLGSALHENVAKELHVSDSRIKLISSGKVIHRNRILEDQDIKNSQQVMAIVLASTPDEANAEQQIYDKVQMAKDDASTLLDSRQSFMEMEDQDGNLIHLPPGEKRALMMALAMHEKGRVALKKELYSEALVMLLEADYEYSTCDSKMLQTVDNYALLNLDIVWCYLMLKSVSQLPDAEKRLAICEQNFKRSYGENLDRLVSLKGTAVNEKALIMRLHLLQAVLLFHRNQRLEARRMLLIAETEIVSLKVDEASVLTLVEMGYSETEARTGLRACSNDIEQAISYIIDRRANRKKARKVGAQQNRAKNLLSKTSDDKWVNPRNLHILNEMGFNSDLCACALKKCDNDINQALTLLQENQTALQEELASKILPNDDVISQMVNMGFHKEMINMALRNVANNMDAAVEMLLRFQSEGKYDETLSLVADLAASGAENGPSTSAANPVQDLAKRLQKEKEVAEAFKRFSEGVENNDDDYLDLPLIQEEKLLLEYKKFLDL